MRHPSHPRSDHSFPQGGNPFIQRRTGYRHSGHKNNVDEKNIFGQPAKIPMAKKMTISSNGELFGGWNVHAAGNQPENENNSCGNTNKDR
jgi:hypothetical protein